MSPSTLDPGGSCPGSSEVSPQAWSNSCRPISILTFVPTNLVLTAGLIGTKINAQPNLFAAGTVIGAVIPFREPGPTLMDACSSPPLWLKNLQSPCEASNSTFAPFPDGEGFVLIRTNLTPNVFVPASLLNSSRIRVNRASPHAGAFFSSSPGQTVSCPVSCTALIQGVGIRLPPVLTSSKKAYHVCESEEDHRQLTIPTKPGVCSNANISLSNDAMVIMPTILSACVW